MAIIFFQNAVLTIHTVEAITGQRKLCVTANDGNEGFQCLWPRGLTANHIQSREAVVFSNFILEETIQTNAITVEGVWETVNRFLTALSQEIDVTSIRESLYKWNLVVEDIAS